MKTINNRLIRHNATDAGFHTTIEKLIDHLEGKKTTLSPKMQKQLERISQAKSWIFQYRNPAKVATMLQNEYQYSEVTAYRDLRLMQQVYGPMLRMNKDLRRALAENMIEQDRQLAIRKEDPKAMTQATKNYINLYQLDKEDPQIPDLSHFEFHPIIFAVLPEQVGLKPATDNQLLKKVDDWWDSQAQDAEQTDT